MTSRDHIGPGGQRPAFQGSTAGRDEAPLPAPTPAGGLGAGTQPDPRGALLLLGGAGPSPSAVHEAAHACVGTLVGRVVEYVTLDPPHCRFAKERSTDRESIEAAIVSTLAGDIAGRNVEPVSGYVEETRHEAAAAQAADWLASLGGRARELLEAAAIPGGGTLVQDENVAAMLSAQLAGDESHLHLEWMRAVSSRLVDASWPLITALARELEARGSLSGTEVAAFIRSAGTLPAQVKE